MKYILIIICLTLIGCNDEYEVSSGTEWNVETVIDEGHTYRVFTRYDRHNVRRGYCWSKHSVNCPKCKEDK